MKHIKTLTAMAAVACCLASTSEAALVLVSTGTVIDGSSTAIGAGSAVVQDTGALPFAGLIPGKFSGTLQTIVWSGDVNNLLGGYTFQYILHNTGPDSLRALTVNGWATGVETRVDNVSPLVLPSALSASQVNPATVDFSWSTLFFGDGLIPAGTTVSVLLQTSLQTWQWTEAQVINGSVAQVAALAPVPEPTTMIAGAMLLLPFAASTVRMLRKNRTA